MVGTISPNVGDSVYMRSRWPAGIASESPSRHDAVRPLIPVLDGRFEVMLC